MILHLTDIHATERYFRWLKSVSPRYGLVCLTGDLLDLNVHRPVSDQVDRVIAHFSAIRAPLMICSGNHDTAEGLGPRLEYAAWLKEVRRPGVWADGEQHDYRGFRFRCIPWGWPLPDAGPNEIWLAHEPPEGCKTSIARGGVGFGSFELGELCRMERGPRLVLSGHVHEPQDWKARAGRTWSLNPGQSGRPAVQPNHIVIDLDRGVAKHHSATGEMDIVRLWQ